MLYLGRDGERVGMLVFRGVADKRGDRNRLYGRFDCDCGGGRLFPIGRVLTTRKFTHCGCRANKSPGRTHGMKNTSTYSSWSSAKDRATNSSSKDFWRYGAVGIGMAERWLSFENFFADMGERPPGTSLDRIDCLKGYEPGNCRWATSKQQGRNKRNGYTWQIKGREFDSIYDAATHFSVSAQTVHRWVRGSYDARRATFTKPRGDCYAIPKY